LNKATQNGVTSLPREAIQALPDPHRRPMSTIEAALSPNAVLEFSSQSAGLVSQSPPVAAVSQVLTEAPASSAVTAVPAGQIAPVASLASNAVPCRSSAISALLATAGVALLACVWPLWPATAGWSLALPILALVWGASSLALGLMFAQRN
jgi:hypothetical protein